MDPDLPDLLLAWTGQDVPDDRRAALLDRLRADAGFRAAAVAEVRLLGQLKAVQSAGPRWLALEDELGWGDDGPAPAVSFEDRVLNELPPAPHARPRGRWLAALAASLVVGGLGLYALRPGPAPGPGPAPVARPAPAFVAVLVKVDGAEWAADGPAPAEGQPLPAGRVKLAAGRAVFTLFSGVTVSLQGPADLDLTDVDRVFCHRGKLRARVSPGGEGFVALAPGSAVVDLGTEFGLNVSDAGRVDMMLFEGKAEVSVLNADGRALRTELLEGRRAVSVDAAAGRVLDVPADPGAFAPPAAVVAPALRPDPGYPDAVRASNPWGYWRFETLADGRTRNEIPGRPPLVATGPVALAGAAGENRAAHFPADRAETHLVLDGDWAPPRKAGYAVEAWVLPEEVNVATLIALTARDEPAAQKHALLLELTGQGHHLVHAPCITRFLDRWPPSNTGGVNAFSRRMYVPYRWHHLVARRAGGWLELYQDGELVGTAPADPGDATAACRLTVGRLKTGKQARTDQIRQFVGRLDELAVYDHPLSPDDIRRHYELGSANRPGR